MKFIKISFLILICMTIAVSGAFAGTGSEVCNTPKGGVKFTSGATPGAKNLQIVLDRHGNLGIFPTSDLIITKTQEHLMSEFKSTGTGMGRGGYSKTYAAKVHIAKRDGTALPGSYSARISEDGTYTLDMICQAVVF